MHPEIQTVTLGILATVALGAIIYSYYLPNDQDDRRDD